MSGSQKNKKKKKRISSIKNTKPNYALTCTEIHQQLLLCKNQKIYWFTNIVSQYRCKPLTYSNTANALAFEGEIVAEIKASRLG